MSLVRLYIKEVSFSQSQRGAYVLVFNESNGKKTLPIVIGAFEAQSIVIALEKDLKPPRPLTHDLFKNFADNFQINLKQVLIYKLVDGIFYANLICEQNGEEKHIDARTSDAVALAIRFGTPIFIYKDILDEAGLYLNPKEDFFEGEDFLADDLLEEEEWEEQVEKKSPFKDYSVKELNQKLTKAVEEENYEVAAQIRDELNQRTQK